jgi:hypothetical protein
VEEGWRDGGTHTNHHNNRYGDTDTDTDTDTDADRNGSGNIQRCLKTGEEKKKRYGIM